MHFLSFNFQCRVIFLMGEWGKGHMGQLKWVSFLKRLGQTVALELWKRLWDPEFIAALVF